MSTLKSNIYLTLLNQIPTQLFGIISGIFITRILGAQGKGIYAIFYADVSLFNTFFGFSIITAIIYFLSAKKITHEKILGVSITFTLITIVLSVSFLCIWLLSPISDLLFPVSYQSYPYIIWFISILLLTQINSVYSGFFQGSKNFKVVNSILFFNSIFNVTIFGCAYLLHYFNIFEIKLYIIFILSLVVLLINTLCWHLKYIKLFSYKIDIKINLKKEIYPFFKYMGLGHLSIIINFFNYRLALWVLAYYLDEKNVGFYSLAVGLAQILTFLTNPLSQVIFPYLTSEFEEQRKLIFTKFARMHFSMLIIIAFFAMFLAPLLIPLMYGNDFYPSVLLFKIMIFAVVLSCQTTIFGGFLLASNRVIINLLATSFGFLLTLFFNYFLIKSFGLIGAAYSTSITYLGIFLFVYFAIIIFMKLPSWNLFFLTREDILFVSKKIIFFKNGNN